MPERKLSIGLSAAFFALLVVSLPGSAEPPKDGADWARWRGPALDGTSPETSWLERWPRVKLKDGWQRDIGRGYSASSVLGSALYTMGYKGKQDVVYCFDLDSGKPKWQFTYDAVDFPNMNDGGPAGTPCIADGLVFTAARDGQVHALDAKSGKLTWRANMSELSGNRPPDWGFSGSPIVQDGTLYLDFGVIFALEAKTGKVQWKSSNYGAGYSTPVPHKFGSLDTIVAFPAYGLVILDRKTGKEIAKSEWKTSYNVNAATPLIIGDQIFISSGYNTGCSLLEFKDSKLTQKWVNKNMRNHMASCVVFEGHLYGFDDALFKCISLDDGSVKWSERGLGKGSLILVKDVLIVLSDRGELMLAKASKDAFKPELRKKVLSDSGCWSAPVLSHGYLLVRSPKGNLSALKVD